MAHCVDCGSDNLDGAKFCGACGGRVPAPAPVQEFRTMRGGPMEVPARAPESFDLMRGQQAAAATMTLPPPPEIRGRDVASGSGYAAGKTPGLAIFLSFIFPGGGQFYNGDTKKGFLLLGLAFVAYLLTIEMGLWFLGMPLSLGVWGWGMLDAGKVARREKALG